MSYVSANRLITFLSLFYLLLDCSSGWRHASVAVDCRLAVFEHQTTLALQVATTGSYLWWVAEQGQRPAAAYV